MAQRGKRTTLTALAGKLGGIRREVQQVMHGLKREIARHEKALAALKVEYGQAADLLSGKAKIAPAPVKTPGRMRSTSVENSASRDSAAGHPSPSTGVSTLTKAPQEPPSSTPETASRRRNSPTSAVVSPAVVHQ